MKPAHKGIIGENKLQRSIDSLDFWGYDGYCLRNTYVPKANGATAEIDLLYITRKGIFVIESKTMLVTFLEMNIGKCGPVRSMPERIGLG